MLSSTKSAAFLIKESDLLESSGTFEEFVDSFTEEEEGEADLGALGEAPPSLESLLNNLSLDMPILSNKSTRALLKPESMTNITSTNTNTNISTTTTSNTNTNAFQHHPNSLSWLSVAFKWEPSNEHNFVIDSGSINESKPIIIYASKTKLIEKLTTVLDYKFMDDFLCTVEMIMHPMDFTVMLLSRLAQAFEAVPGWNFKESVDPEVVKMRGLVVLQHWAGIMTQNHEPIENNLDYSIRRLIIEVLDVIWQRSRSLSQSDQIFLIKIRRLFDPRGEISLTTTASPEDELIGNDSETSSVFDSERLSVTAPSQKWRDKLKIRLKAIFTKSSSIDKSSKTISSPQSSSSFLINSFTSDAECNEEFSSVLMTQRSKTLAVILAVLEWDLFKGINRSELVSFPLARESPQLLAETCPNLQRAIEHFNSMCQWFVQLISESDDSALLAKIIRLAVKSVLIHNYNTAMQIILALQSPAISNRKDLWISLPSWERHLAKDLAVFGSPIKNFKNVRKAQEEISFEDVAAVPFNGLFLSDLIFNLERCSMEASKDKTKEASSSSLLPFYKNQLAAKIVRQFLAFKNPRHQFERNLNGKERQLYSYFADIGRLGGEFSM